MAKERMRMGDMDEEDIPKSLRNNNNGKKKKRKKKKSKARIILRILLVLFIIIVILVGVAIGFIYSKFGKIENIKIDKNEIEVNEGIKGATGFRNIVLYGVDSRKNSYEGTLSDTIMIVAINQDNKKVKIASVYRDSYLKIGKSFDKITHAYSKGPATSLSALNTNLDLNLSEFVTVNFAVVVDVINAVGGVDIDITKEETKYINDYINEINEVTGHNSAHVTTPGKQHLDGVQALGYSRIRYTSGGDYKRTERQREVLNLVFDKVKKMNVWQLNSLADKILPAVSTNISTNDIIGLLTQVASYDIEETTGWPYNIRGYQPHGVWYGAPVNLAENVKKLHEFLFDEQDYQVSSTVQSISNALIKETGYSK